MPDARQEIALPALALVGEVGPLAGERALGARGAAAGAPGQVVGEVEEQAGPRPGLRQMPLQPHQLGDLHLGRHHAADMVEHAMAAGGAFLGLGDGAVVEPDDRVPVPVAGGRDRQRPARRGRAPRASRWRRSRCRRLRAGLERRQRHRLAHRRRRRACQMSSELCSAWSGCGRLSRIRRSAAAQAAARARRTRPARALPVPTSTPMTSWSIPSSPISARHGSAHRLRPRRGSVVRRQDQPAWIVALVLQPVAQRPGAWRRPAAARAPGSRHSRATDGRPATSDSRDRAPAPGRRR